MQFDVVILAAGKGTRMRSSLPKVLHPVAGKAIAQHVIDTVSDLGAQNINVVIGHGAELVREQLHAEHLHFVVQEQQLGTGHAVQQAAPHITSEYVLVLLGDTPLIAKSTLQNLLDNAQKDGLVLLTVDSKDPTGLGRIVRQADGQVSAIVEHKDATDEQRQITETNTGIMLFHRSVLDKFLFTLSADNAQAELYLTDLIEKSVSACLPVITTKAGFEYEVLGVNNRLQLAQLERIQQGLIAEQLMIDGATLADPARIDVRGHLTVGEDCFIDVGCVFIGDVVLGSGVRIAANCTIENTKIGDGVEIKPNTVTESAEIHAGAIVGPFARIRPGSVLGVNSKVGNFVETKKTLLGEGSKINHLSYVGDAELGDGVNVGAGTITCNYDGVNKFKTQMGNGVFIGSNSTLVAPLTIADGAFVGAGSTITGDVKTDQLAVGRAKQRNIDGWKRPTKG